MPKLVDVLLRDFVQSGMSLADSPEKLDKWHNNEARIETLCSEFHRNLRESSDAGE